MMADSKHLKDAVAAGLSTLLILAAGASRSSPVEKLLGYFQKDYVCCKPIRSDLRDIIPVNAL